MTLTYPSQLNPAMTDYMVFTPHEYRSNASGEDGPATGQSIVLYMPNSTPAARNNNKWAGVGAEGPFGAAMRDLGGTFVNAAQGFEFGDAAGQQAILDDFQRAGENLGSNAGGMVRQKIVEGIAGLAGHNANQLLSIKRGEIYNPNIELAYGGPELRGFAFSFQFIPKNAGETNTINQIIKHMKERSAAEDKNGMLKIPDVWRVRYMSRGSQNRFMNEFKRMACTDVMVQANASTNMHQSFSDGMPVSTTLSLSFQEVDIVLRGDHSQSASAQGF